MPDAAAMRSPWLQPDWPAPAPVRSLQTTRQHPQGPGRGGCAGFNLAQRGNDDAAAVSANRALLATQLPAAPIWLQQVHGVHIMVAAQQARYPSPPQADGCIARQPQQVCAVLTADCIPVLLCDRAGSTVAAVHAGWRGLYAGILAQAVAHMQVAPDQLMAWLGPAISVQHYRVDADFRSRFLRQNERFHQAFVRHEDGIHADLPKIARIQLEMLGVEAVYGGQYCTYARQDMFYSHRRDPASGRQASLIWLQP